MRAPAPLSLHEFGQRHRMSASNSSHKRHRKRCWGIPPVGPPARSRALFSAYRTWPDKTTDFFTGGKHGRWGHDTIRASTAREAPAGNAQRFAGGEMIRRRHDLWSLLGHVTCVTSILWLVVSAAPKSAASDTEEGILGDNASEVGAARENSRNPNDLLLFPTPASIPPVEPPWPVHRQNSTEPHDEPSASHPKVPEGSQTRKWHFTYISARFLTGRAFRARASAVSRAVVGAVFIAISLIIAVAMFTCIWCCCRCDKGHGYDEQIELPTASYSSYPPPMPGQDKVARSGACPASARQSTDLPPPYDLPSLHVVVSPKAVPGRPRTMAAVPEDEQPPPYHTAVSSILPNAQTDNIGAPTSR